MKEAANPTALQVAGILTATAILGAGIGLATPRPGIPTDGDSESVRTITESPARVADLVDLLQRVDPDGAARRRSGTTGGDARDETDGAGASAEDDGEADGAGATDDGDGDAVDVADEEDVRNDQHDQDDED